MRSAFLKAWLLCGSLDLAYAIASTLLHGASVADMLTGLASGPFGDGVKAWGAGAVLAGFVVHFVLMAAMTAVGVFLFQRTPLANANPWLAGTLYGLAIYCVMYGIVLPQRFGAPFPNPDKLKLAIGLFPHIAFVGIPMAFLLRKPLR